MADRVSASITIGGTIASVQFARLCDEIELYALSLDWDGAPFEAGQETPGEPLRLHAHEVAWGRFDSLEAYLLAESIAFVRWAGGYGGNWGAERVVAPGDGSATSYIADEEDRILIDLATVEQLGSLAAITAHFAAADFAVPSLVVTG